MPADFSGHVATLPTDLRGAYELRLRVFSDEQGYDCDRDIDSLDDVAVPVVLVHAGAVCAVLRILPYPLPDVTERYFSPSVLTGGTLPGQGRSEESMVAYMAGQQKIVASTDNGAAVVLSGGKLGRIAVSSAVRGMGHGRRIVLAAEAWLQQALRDASAARDADRVDARVQLSAQVTARAFYERLGYAGAGEPYLEEGQPHMWYAKVIRVRG
ncbi:hypothetical protein MSPP1_000281 [Malassezia sp. CBS 17886]|nr:hypothetical protein MSPP1_000281 [Malassezia sp. CBS 17886]